MAYQIDTETVFYPDGEQIQIPHLQQDVWGKTLDLYRDPQIAQQMFLKEPALFFAMHCTGLAPGETVTTPNQYPNPFGDAPIDGRSIIEFVAYDDALKTLTMRTDDRADPASLEQAVVDMASRFSPGTDMAAEMKNLPPFEKTLTGRIVYSTVDGFPVEVEFRQVVGNQDHPSYISETWTWVRVADPGR